MSIVDTNALPLKERLPGWKEHSFSTESMTFGHYDFSAGSKIHEHCHSNEEVWTVIEGELLVTVGGDAILAKPGLVAVVPPYMAHSVRAVTDGKAIVADSPVRIDSSGGLRAVVKIEFNTPVALAEIQNGGALRVPYTLWNWGKTRATVKQFRIECKIAKTLPAPTATEIASGDLPTVCEVGAGERHAGSIAHPGLSAQVRDDVLRGESILFLRGAILYDDGFGSRQYSSFCRVYDSRAFDGKGGFVDPEQPGHNYGS